MKKLMILATLSLSTYTSAQIVESPSYFRIAIPEYPYPVPTFPKPTYPKPIPWGPISSAGNGTHSLMLSVWDPTMYPFPDPDQKFPKLPTLPKPWIY